MEKSTEHNSTKAPKTAGVKLVKLYILNATILNTMRPIVREDGSQKACTHDGYVTKLYELATVPRVPF